MTEKLDQKEITTFDELFWSNVYQIDAVTQLLVEKGIFTEKEFFTKLKEVQGEWDRYAQEVTHTYANMEDIIAKADISCSDSAN